MRLKIARKISSLLSKRQKKNRVKRARAPACRMVYRRCRNKMCKQKEELLLQSITMKAASAHKVQTQTGCTMIWWTKEKLWRKLQIVIVTIHTLIEFKNKRMCRSISFQSSIALCLSHGSCALYYTFAANADNHKIEWHYCKILLHTKRCTSFAQTWKLNKFEC